MSETILVVDDEENIRHTLRGVLADEGFEVLEAPDGRRALELLRHAAPRLAIVDVWMPEMDGIELVERMRNQAPGVPIDRKSTRLNSSHLGISYAVFCLKKKK